MDEKWMDVWTSRPDLQKVYPEVANGILKNFEGWIAAYGVREYTKVEQFPSQVASRPMTVVAPPAKASPPETPEVEEDILKDVFEDKEEEKEEEVPDALPKGWRAMSASDLTDLANDRGIKLPDKPTKAWLMVSLKKWEDAR